MVLSGAGWRRPVASRGARWILRGGGGRAEIRRPKGATDRIACEDPLSVLRALLRREGGRVFGFFGYEALASRSERRKRGSPPTPDFLWISPDENIPSRKKSPPGVSYPTLKTLRVPGRAAYERGARRILKYVAAGDIYQANLSHPISFPSDGLDPRGYFDVLQALNPSPYAFYMDAGDFQVASCSPELLLRVRGGRVVTRPIAGTRPRGRSVREDRRLRGELLLSPKERAEHVMLLDLERNDLGRVCRPGSVRVSERMALEKYSHVTHIVSQVEGRLAAGFDGLGAFRAVFPGGTITGCPKVRCMKILADLERVPRGPFYGAAGWIDADGDCELNILIRTALFHRGKMSLRVGAGIVADSDPRREWEETLHKARALLAARERMLHELS